MPNFADELYKISNHIYDLVVLKCFFTDNKIFYTFLFLYTLKNFCLFSTNYSFIYYSLI